MCHNVCIPRIAPFPAPLYFFKLFFFGWAGSWLLCALSSLVSANRGYSLVMVCRLLIEVTSLTLGVRASVVAAAGPQSTGSIVVVDGLSWSI